MSRLNKIIKTNLKFTGFEENSALYISKIDTEKIKESIAKNNYQNIFALAVKHSNEIVAKVILKNSWLIDFSKISKNRTLFQKFSKIFENISNEFFLQISSNIVNDNSYSSIEFKQFIEELYYKKIDKKLCNKIYSDKQNKIENRCICFYRHLNEEYAPKNTGANIVRFINLEFENHPEIYNYLNNQSNSILQNIFKDASDEYVVAKWIIENKIGIKNDIVKNDKLWKNAFTSLSEGGFKASVEYINNHPTYDDATSKFLIQKILPRFYKIDMFNDSILSLYANHYSIRILLIYMLGPSKFKSKEIAQDILSKFEGIDSFRPNWMNSVNEIRNWEKRDDHFDNSTEVLEKIENPKTKLSNQNTLKYFSSLLSKSNFSLIKELYENNSGNEKVLNTLSYFFASLFSSEKELRRLNPFEKLDLSQIYINSISQHIDNMHINTKFSKQFLEKHKQFETLKKFNRR